MPILGSQSSGAKGAPTAPTVGTATVINSTTVSLTFTAPSSKLPITSYTVASSPSIALSTSGVTSPLTVTGSFASGQAYTFTITATNANGTSTASSASSAVTFSSVPQAPTIGTVTRTNNTTVSIPFTAGSNGGSPITGYTATSSPSIALSVSGTSSPLTVTGSFVGGVQYTFQISAVNAIGSSTPSSSSNAVYPIVYAVGSIGPSGGRVFYDAGSTLSWGRFIEVIQDDQLKRWSGNVNTLVGTSTAIGAGRANTNAAIAQDATENKAITYARSFTNGGFSGPTNGWSLPSKDELNALRQLIPSMGYFEQWSSSEDSATHVWAQNVEDGYQFTDNKNNDHGAVPTRAF